MFDWKYLKSALRVGLLLGLIFGVANLMFSWLFPLLDDTKGVLLSAWGPVFFAWAFATICVFDILNLPRFHLFLNELTGRADWQGILM